MMGKGLMLLLWSATRGQMHTIYTVKNSTGRTQTHTHTPRGYLESLIDPIFRLLVCGWRKSGEHANHRVALMCPRIYKLSNI